MNQKRKKQIAILLVCCMLFTLLPTTALASEPMPIASGSGRTQTVTNSQLLFAAMADTSVTTIMLDADITIDATLYVGAIDDARTVTLDLNGHVLKAVSADNCIYIFPESYLILQDSAPNNTHSDMTLPVGGVITNSSCRGVSNCGTFTMNGGTIADGKIHGYGGGVYNEGTFTMNGGLITNCEADYGGGGVNNRGTFTMNGGRITNCEADNGGGGVYISRNSTFTMNGNAKIIDCEAEYGGGVLNYYGNFVMNDNTEISNCEAKEAGGVENFYKFIMNGGSITNCRATDFGGGVVCCGYSDSSYGELILRGGNISNCTAPKGGGVYLEVHEVGNQKLCADGGEIHGNVYMSYYDAGHNSIITNSADAESVTVFYGDLTKEDGTIIDGHVVTFLLENDEVYAWEVVPDGGKVVKPTAPSGMMTSFDWYNGNRVYTFTETVTSDLTLKIGSAQEYHYSGGGGYYAPEEETDKANKTEETTWSNPFIDVSETDWYYHAVKYAHQHKLFAGMSTTEFAPNMPMGRGMLVTVLYRMAGSPAVEGDMPFVDVNSGAYYRNAILWAVQNNIVSGIADNLFAPDTDITREQLAVILYRFAQYCGYDTTQGGMQIREYSDYEDISGYALNAMTWAVNSGLLKGKGENNVASQDTATRAEVAAILQRFIENNQ